MRIVHCIWSLNTGGVEEMLIDITNVQSLSDEVHVIVVNDDFTPQMIEKFAPTVKVHLIRRKRGSRLPWAYVKLNLLLLKLRPDAIHLQNVDLAPIVLPLRRHHKVMTVHAVGYRLRGAKLTSRIVAISNAVRDDVKRRYGIECDVIFNGIDASKISVRPLRMRPQAMQIVQVGRLNVKEKGQDILIRALAILVKRGYNDIQVSIIGDGPDMAMLRQLATDLGVGANVKFLGLQDKSHIYAHLSDYDLMVHPARSEGFGLTIAEGMVARLPICVPSEGGPYEVTDNGRYSVNFITESPEACAEAIAHCYDDYSRLLHRLDEARQYAIDNYSIERTAKQYISTYKKY